MLAKPSFLFQSFFPQGFFLLQHGSNLGANKYSSLWLGIWNFWEYFSDFFMFLLRNLKLWQIALLNLVLCEGAVMKLFPCLQLAPWCHCTFLVLIHPLAANGSSCSALQQLYCSTNKENTSIWCIHPGDPTKTPTSWNHHKHANWIQHILF